MKYLWYLSFFFLLALGFAYFHKPKTDSVAIAEPTSVFRKINENSLFDTIQEWRLREGLPRYQKSDFLCEIAEKRLGDIKQNYSHDGFRATLEQFCKNDCTVSENLVHGPLYGEETALNAWLNSASHSAALRENYKFSCVKSDGYYAVHLFGNF